MSSISVMIVGIASLAPRSSFSMRFISAESWCIGRAIKRDRTSDRRMASMIMNRLNPIMM
jgi:hypothetical protein